MRPEILFPLYAPVTALKGVGPRVAPLLEKLAGPVVRDVLFLRPHSFIRRTRSTVVAAIEGEVQTFEVTIDAYRRNNVLRTEVKSRDVAELAAEMCGALFAKTTGAQLPVDGGNDRVI